MVHGFAMTSVLRHSVSGMEAPPFLVATPVLASVLLALMAPQWAWLWLALALWSGLAPLLALIWRWWGVWRHPWLVSVLSVLVPFLPLPAGLLLLALLRLVLPLRLAWQLEPPATRLFPAGHPWVEGALLAAVPVAMLAI